jgi:hypothetical protein
MQISTRLLSLISAQQTLLASKDNQTERLSAELNRIEKGKQPYYIAVGVRTAIKLIHVADKLGLHIFDLLRIADEKTRANQKWELKLHKGEMEEMRLKEAHRKELTRITAAGFLQSLHTAIANRASENLCQAQILIIGADGNPSRVSYLPAADQLAGQLAELKDLTVSYAHDLAEYGETIAKYDQVLDDDGFEMRTQKEALHMVQNVAVGLLNTATSLVDTAETSLSGINSVGHDAKKERLEWLAAYGVAAATLAKFAATMLNEAIASLGTVTVVARVTKSTIASGELYGDLTALTNNKANFHLN